jgi:membrane protein YdbS with pleckstrin-like domain
MTPLEAGQLRVMRIRAVAFALALFGLAALGEAVLRGEFGVPLGSVTLPLLPPLLWFAVIAPPRRFRAWAYCRTDEDLQLRHGIWTEVRTLVPLDRVQHIDISQGPLERLCGVCRLVLHTAGTANSEVVLPGLSRETAESMRDDIRARIRQDYW